MGKKEGECKFFLHVTNDVKGINIEKEEKRGLKGIHCSFDVLSPLGSE